LMIAELLEVKLVEAVLSVPFSDAVKLIAVPVGLVVRLMVVPKLEFSVSVVDWPTVRLMVPETTDPLVDCFAACTVATVPAGDTRRAVASPEEFTLTKLELVVTLQVADPVSFLLLPSSKTPRACS